MEVIFSGIVIHGKKRGRMLGYPTANISLQGRGAAPGVYAGYTRIDGEWIFSAIFIDTKRKILETHLLDFSGNLYGKVLEVKIAEKIRDSIQFDSLEELKKQIAKDVLRARGQLNEG